MEGRETMEADALERIRDSSTGRNSAQSLRLLSIWMVTVAVPSPLSVISEWVKAGPSTEDTTYAGVVKLNEASPLPGKTMLPSLS